MKIKELLEEDVESQCHFCKESEMKVGEKTDYNSIVIFKIGNSNEDGWFATLSPKTGSDPEQDFTIQIMPFAHLTHFAQMFNYPALAKNYGVAFGKISMAMTEVMAEKGFNVKAETRDEGTAIATYGKCTTWKEKKEHLHIKLFPFRGVLGQPSTVDSTFGRKEVQKDPITGEKFVKMTPVKKRMIPKEKFERLSRILIELMNK